MIPLVSDVNSLVRALLGDTEVAGGQIATNAQQQPWLNSAYQELFSSLLITDAPEVRRQSYYAVQPNTVIVAPSTMGISNFGSPEEMWERPILATFTVSGAVASSDALGNPLVTITTTTPHGLATGDTIEIYGIKGLSDDVNDSWAVTVTGGSTFEILGCSPSGAYSSGGVVIQGSGEDWNGPLDPEDYSTQQSSSPQPQIGWYSWARERFRFPQTSIQREIMIVYQLSGQAPTGSSDSLGIDNSLNFLAHRTAAKIAQSKAPKRFADLMTLADNFLADFLGTAVREMQNGEPIVPPPYRAPRNVYPLIVS